MSTEKYFTPREIALHNTIDDLWVIVFGKVFNLTPLLKDQEDDSGTFPLIVFGGKDISHFFLNQTKVRHHVNPNTNQIDGFAPFGTFIDLPTQEQVEKAYVKQKEQDEKLVLNLMERIKQQMLCKDKTEFSDTKLPEKDMEVNGDPLPWWKNDEYVIGKLTCKSRWIRIRDTWTFKTVVLEVCSEDTINDILERYLKFNSHAKSYAWKFMGRQLMMDRTLSENDVPDLDLKAERLGLNGEVMPTLNLYFQEDQLK